MYIYFVHLRETKLFDAVIAKIGDKTILAVNGQADAGRSTHFGTERIDFEAHVAFVPEHGAVGGALVLGDGEENARA